MGAVVEINENNFAQEVGESELPVLVDYWAAWCGPCKMVAPVVEEIASESAGTLKVGKIDIEENQQLAANAGVRSIPTLILFKGGEPVATQIGAVSKAELQNFINQHLSS